MQYETYIEQYVSYDPTLARRCWAATIDYLVYFAALLIYSYLRGNIPEWRFEGGRFLLNATPGFFVVVFAWIVYFPLIEAIFGYTLGKGLFDLKVVRERKNDFPLAVSLKRHLLDPIDFFFFGLVAVLLVKFTKEHKRLGDMWAHSRVLKEGEKIPPPVTSQPVAILQRTFPVGMIILCVYLGYSIVTELLTFNKPVMLIGPFAMNQPFIIAWQFLSIAVPSIGLYGVLKRIEKARILLIGWFGFGIIFIVVHLVFSLFYMNELPQLYQKMFPDQTFFSNQSGVLISILLISVIVAAIDAFICWYLWSKKEFFAKV